MKSPLLAIGAVLSLLCAPAASHAVPSACDAKAGNIVANCGFETGSFSGWAVTSAAFNSLILVDQLPASGTYGAVFAAFLNLDDAISQLVQTVASETYLLEFQLASGGAGQDHFKLSWNGNTLLELRNAPEFDYTSYSFLVTGTGSDTLRFAGFDVPKYFTLDDVSLTVYTPEPASFALFAVGFAGLVARRRQAPLR